MMQPPLTGLLRCGAGALLVTIVRQEGVGALFKGALPRALWVAPVGAMNFAGGEPPLPPFS